MISAITIDIAPSFSMGGVILKLNIEKKLLEVIRTDYRAGMPSKLMKSIKLEKDQTERITNTLEAARTKPLPHSIRGLDGTEYRMIIEDEKGSQKIDWWCSGGRAYKPFLAVTKELEDIAGMLGF